MLLYRVIFYGPLAQLVEQETLNLCVDGSSPSWITKKRRQAFFYFFTTLDYFRIDMILRVHFFRYQGLQLQRTCLCFHL